MKTALTAAGGVLLCLGLTACESTGERGESRRSVPPHVATAEMPAKPLPRGPVAKVEPYDSGAKVLRGEDAIREMQARQQSGQPSSTVGNSMSWEDGKMTLKMKYSDGSSMSIVSGTPEGNVIEFRPGN